MKLVDKYNRVTLLASFVVLVFTGVIYYTVIHFILTERLDKDLSIEEDEVEAYAAAYGKLPLPGNFKDQTVQYVPLDSGEVVAPKYLYTDYYNESEHANEPGRSLITSVKVQGKNYQVTITKSRVEAEYLVRIIFYITLGVTVLLIVTLILVNRLILNRLWKPFNTVLTQMKAFNLRGKNEIEPALSNIDEFNELNQSAVAMSLRVKDDYKELKSFTDNAAHELMTPMAVINSKLDTLIQTETFTDRQGELIEDVYAAVRKLSRLNQSLLLLAKIENNLITDQEDVDLQDLLTLKLRQFQELFQAEEIVVTFKSAQKVLLFNKYLADILINNLISNAIRHNYKGGRIDIVLDQEQLIVSNTSIMPALDGSKAFERFYKNTASEGMGLGLAISRQICMLYQLELSYHYSKDMHQFEVNFEGI